MKEALEQDTDHKIKLAVFDHIISALSMILPVSELIELCHQHNVQVSTRALQRPFPQLIINPTPPPKQLRIGDNRWRTLHRTDSIGFELPRCRLLCIELS